MDSIARAFLGNVGVGSQPHQKIISFVQIAVRQKNL